MKNIANPLPLKYNGQGRIFQKRKDPDSLVVENCNKNSPNKILSHFRPEFPAYNP